MNIQIDTLQKTLKLSEAVNLKELAEVLDKLFPNGTWKEYKLETNTVINNWSNPIYIDRWVYPTYPWWSSGSTNSAQMNIPTFTTNGEGIYNISMNAESQETVS